MEVDDWKQPNNGLKVQDSTAIIHNKYLFMLLLLKSTFVPNLKQNAAILQINLSLNVSWSLYTTCIKKFRTKSLWNFLAGSFSFWTCRKQIFQFKTHGNNSFVAIIGSQKTSLGSNDFIKLYLLVWYLSYRIKKKKDFKLGRWYSSYIRVNGPLF